MAASLPFFNAVLRDTALRAGLTATAGRGLFAARAASAGEPLYEARPTLVAPASGAFCPECLARTAPEAASGSFCSAACRAATASSWRAGSAAGVDLSSLDAACRAAGVAAPRLAARAALTRFGLLAGPGARGFDDPVSAARLASLDLLDHLCTVDTARRAPEDAAGGGGVGNDNDSRDEGRADAGAPRRAGGGEAGRCERSRAIAGRLPARTSPHLRRQNPTYPPHIPPL